MNASVIIGRLLESSLLNLEIFFVTLLLGLPLGLLISFGSMSRWSPFRFLAPLGSEKHGFVKWLANLRPISALVQIFVWIIRGTPLMLQVIIVFYGPGLIWGGKAMGRMEAALLAFVINYACYFSEIFRGGIQSMPVGQKEAGQVLGMTRSQIFFKVTLLQVIKRIVPPMGNEFITLVKDTSLARIIANKEIIMMAQEFAASDALIWPLFSTAIFFLVACGILTLLLNYTEKKLSYFK